MHPCFFMNIYFFHRTIFYIKYNAVQCSIVCTIILATFLPLRCPTVKPFLFLNLNEIGDDLQICSASKRTEDKKVCDLVSKEKSTFIYPNLKLNSSLLQNMHILLEIEAGGRWVPKHCTPWQRVAVVIPYRDREEHLLIFLQHIHPFLQAQALDYGVFVIEQSERGAFNRGKLFNIGYKEALKESEFCCFIFHDVDLLPESPQHTYGCSSEPRHMCSALDTFRYVLPYPELFGGVVAFTKEQFFKVNGYSNLYFGWGGEDDDLFDRLTAKGMKVRRWAPHLSRYTMMFHKKDVPNPHRINLLKTGKQRIDNDGLNTLEYKVLKIEAKHLYTHILVDLT